MADEEKKKKKRKPPPYTTKEELDTLEPYQLETLKAQADRYANKLPKELTVQSPPVQGDSFTHDLAGWVKQAPSAIGEALKKGWDYWTSSPYRALEAPAQALETISWPVTKLAEIQPFSETVQQAGKNIREKLHSKSVKYGELAGGYEPSGAAEVLGSLKWPWPGPKPIKSEKFIPTKQELGTLGKEVGKGATAGGTYGVLAETDKPAPERDYLKAVRDWAAIGGAGHAAAGALSARGSRKKAPSAPPTSSHGVVLPEPPPPPTPGEAPRLELPNTPTDPAWQQPKGPEPPPFMGVTDELMKQEPIFPPPSRVMHGDGNIPAEPVLPPGQQQRAPLDFGLPPTDVPLGEAPSAITHKEFMGSKIPFVKPEELTQKPLQSGVKPVEPFMGKTVDYAPPDTLPHDSLGQNATPVFMGERVPPLEELPKGPGAPNFMGDTVDFVPPHEIPAAGQGAPNFMGESVDFLPPHELPTPEPRPSIGAPKTEGFDLLGQHVNELEDTIPLTERVPDTLHPLSSAMPEDVLDVPEVRVNADRPSPEELQRMLQQGRPGQMGLQPAMPEPMQDLLAEAMPGMKPIKDYLELGPIKQSIREQQAKAYHGTHRADLSQLDPREVTSIDSMGSWVTSSPDHARRLYGPNVKEASDLGATNLLDVPWDPSHTDNFKKFFFSDKDLFAQTFGRAPAEGEIEALYRKPTLPLKPTAKDKARHATQTAMREQYIQAFRKKLEDAGYGGVRFKNSLIDLRKGDDPHDVTLLFNKEPIKLQDFGAPQVPQGQMDLAGLPAPEIGAKPNIAREATLEEMPLFSKEAQTPEPEQMPMLEIPQSQYGDIHPPDPGVAFKDPESYTSFDIAATPRHNLPPALQDDLLARTAYARDTMGIAGDERGFSIPIEGQGMGGTPERHASSTSPTFPWYKEVTTEGGLKPKDVENALRKIEQDQGLDKGKYVERVKEALLNDREFVGWKRAGEVSDTPTPHEESLAGGESYEPTWEDMDALAEDSGGLHTEVNDEVNVDKSMMQKLSDTLNNERGSVSLGAGVGPLEKSFLTVRRFAERHPEFQPTYQLALDEGQMATATSHDFRTTAAPYYKLTQQDRAIVNKILRDRRRLGRPVPIPQQFQPAVQSIDDMMASAYQFINDVRSTKGLAPIAQDQFYVPFSRSGDYLVILNGPAATTPKWVSAVGTLREAEALSRQLEQRFPGSTTNVKYGSNKKGDQPALDFATLQQIENAGFITRDEYENIIKQFDLPPGYAEHFRQAQKVMGEAEDLLDPIERYIQATSAYGARFLYDDHLKASINTLKDPMVRQYAESYREYLRNKPVEFSRLRGAVAKWDLALNVGSMAQNASQVPVLGFPMLQRAVGDIKTASKIFKDGFSALLHPTQDDLRILALAEREGHTRPVNAEELFGSRTIDQTGVEFGAPAIQRQMERGALSPQVARMLRKPVDLLAAGVEKSYDAAQRADQYLGQRTSYALNRLLGHSQPIAQDMSQKAHGILMAGFASIEEMNRKWAMLAGVRAGRHLGLSEPEAYEYAKKFSRDVNFDYSPASRSPLYRGAGAPLGLFATFGTEALSTYSKVIREQLKKPGLGKLSGAATTALAAYWTMAGIKGLPGVDDFDVHGPVPGMLSDTLPDWLYHGPASASTGLDIASKFKIGPRLPIDMQNGGLDLSQIAVAQPFQNVGMGADWFLHSPMDAPSMQLAGERMLPPSLRAAATAGRWAGLGPEGAIEHGAVGTLRGHTPGPTSSGEKDFFRPSMKDVALKALGFTPLELSKQYARGRIEQVKSDRMKDETTALVNGAANDLDRNGENAPSANLTRLRDRNPQTYRELMKAWARRKAGEQASTREIYRKMQEPKPIAKRKQHGNQG